MPRSAAREAMAVTQVPADVRALLWDVDPEALGQEHAAFLIARILEWGGEEACAWMLSTFGRARVGEVLRRSRALTRKSAAFWAAYLGIPREEVASLRRGRWTER